MVVQHSKLLYPIRTNMAGLLGNSWDDPQTMATMQLAAGLLGTGSLGDGMSRGLTGYTSQMNNATEQQLKKMQVANAALQLKGSQAWLDAVNGSDFGGSGQSSQPGLSSVQMGGLGSGTSGIMPQTSGAPILPATAGSPSGSGTSALNPAGFNPQFARMMAIADRGEYFKAQAASMAPTDLGKTLIASGIQPGTPQYQSAMSANVNKQNYIAPTSVRPGGAVRTPDGKMEFLPHVPDGFQPSKDANGNWQITPVNGGLDALSQTAKAGAFGKLQGTLGQGVDANGNPTYFLGAPPGTTGAPPLQGAPTAAPGSTQPAPMRNNNPGALMPGGKLAQYATPEAGIAALDANLQNYGQQGVNTVQGIISKWAPPSENNTAAYVAQVAQTMGVKPDQPLDMTSPYVRHMLATGIMKQENGVGALTPPPADSASTIRPANAPGFNQFQEGLATAGAKRYNDLISLASDSPARVDVINKAVALSQQGVSTGPGMDWQNNIAGMVSNMPGFRDTATAKGWKEDISHYQELSKFINQNAQRAWQAAGGTGTDAQLDASVNANINNKMFPQALQEVGQWAKAGELAVQAKANASQQAGITTPGKQTNFENTWRQNFDPVIFQLKTQTPQQQQATVDGLKKAGTYDAMLKKAGNLKLLGAL
jgi:hypothetical protein